MSKNKQSQKIRPISGDLSPSRICFVLTKRHHILLQELKLRESKKQGKKVNQGDIMCFALELFEKCGDDYQWHNYLS